MRKVIDTKGANFPMIGTHVGTMVAFIADLTKKGYEPELKACHANFGNLRITMVKYEGEDNAETTTDSGSTGTGETVDQGNGNSSESEATGSTTEVGGQTAPEQPETVSGAVTTTESDVSVDTETGSDEAKPAATRAKPKQKPKASE